MKKEYEAIEKYQKENIRRFVLKLNKKTDADLIKHLDKKKNRQGYLKELIKNDMEK